MKNRTLQFILFIMIFFYLYSPPFRLLPVGPIKLFVVISYIYLLYDQKYKIFFSMLGHEFVAFVALFIFSLCRDLTAGNWMISYQMFLLFAEMLPAAFMIVDIFLKNGGDETAFSELFISVAGLAGIISLILISLPELNLYIKMYVLKYDEEFLRILSFRGAGLSDDLFFSYAIVQGIATIFLLQFYENRKYYIPLFIVVFISIFFNARIGLVPVLVGLPFLFAPRRLPRTLFVMGMVTCVVFFLALVWGNNSEFYYELIEWNKSGSEEIMGVLETGKTQSNTNLGYLFGQMVIFPDHLSSWILGTGKWLFGDNRQPTDIGYFLMLNYGGLVYLGGWMVILYGMFRRLFEINLKNNWINYTLLISLLICNYKGMMFFSKPGFRSIFLIYSFFVIENAYRTRVQLLTTQSKAEII